MEASDIKYIDYKDESQLPLIMALVSKDLSEPYSIFTYRYFLHKWPELCVCAYTENNQGESEMVGTIVCKAEEEEGEIKGYIAMLTVTDKYRKVGIGSKLATMGIDRMIAAGCVEIVLETEITNGGAISLYEKMGFIKEERLARYYLNGGDAFRLRLWVDAKEDGASEDKVAVIANQMENTTVSEAAEETKVA